MKICFGILLCIATLALTACRTTPAIDYDQSAVSKMASYTTFALDSREVRSKYQNVVLSPIVDRRIESALIETLSAKGFKQASDNPDFRITFDTATKTKREVSDIGVRPIPFGRYPYYSYANYSKIITREYEEGSFIVDVIDNASKELVWRGVYIKTLGWSAPTDAEVTKIIREILENFPPQ